MSASPRVIEQALEHLRSWGMPTTCEQVTSLWRPWLGRKAEHVQAQTLANWWISAFRQT